MKINQSTLRLTFYFPSVSWYFYFLCFIIVPFYLFLPYPLHFQGLRTVNISGASELVQLMEMFAVKSGDLSLMPMTHVVEEENQLTQVVL